MRLPVALLFAAQLRCVCTADDGPQPDCYAYVTCSDKLGDPTAAATYGVETACWTTQEAANRCAMECQVANQMLKASGAAADAGCTFFN